MSSLTETAKNMPSRLWDEVMAYLLREPDFGGTMGKVLIDALKSETWFFDKTAGAVVSRPDTRSQLEAIKLIMAYAEGLPLQRIFEHKINETRGALRDILAESPETLAAVKREVEKAEFRTRKGPRKVEEIDVPEVVGAGS